MIEIKFETKQITKVGPAYIAGNNVYLTLHGSTKGTLHDRDHDLVTDTKIAKLFPGKNVRIICCHPALIKTSFEVIGNWSDGTHRGSPSNGVLWVYPESETDEMRHRLCAK